MRKVGAAEFAEMSAPMLRLTEVRYLFDRFKSSRNAEPNHGLFLLTVYFDALVFCLVSIEEMVDDSTRELLRSIGSFVFFKALRNIAAHHAVLSGIKGKFERPISRLVSVGVGYDVEFSEQFFLVPERLRNIFASIQRPDQKRTIERAGDYLTELEASGGKIMIADLIQNVIADIEPHIA